MNESNFWNHSALMSYLSLLKSIKIIKNEFTDKILFVIENSIFK